MIRTPLPGCWYVDALPTGEWCACRYDGPVLNTWRGDMKPPDRLLFPRLSDSAVMAGIAHSSDIAYQWDGSAWVGKGKACGPNGLIFNAQGELVVSNCGPGIGTQGYRYVATDGRLVTGDETYSPTNGIELHEWTDLGDGYRVGQGPSDNGAFLFNPMTGRYHEVISGKARFVRAHRQGDAVSVACWVESAHAAEIVWGTLAELTALPSVASPRIVRQPVPPPPEPPAPEPEPEPEPTPEPTPAPAPEPEPEPIPEPEQRTERRMYGNQEVWLTPTEAAAIDKIRGVQ